MKPTVSAVIFDLDGTLVDSLEDLADSVNRALAEYSLPVHPVAAYRYFLGMGVDCLMRSAMPEGSPESLVKDVTSYYRADYARNWSNKGRPYDGILPMLRQLAESGIPMSILSNKSQVFTDEFVRHFFPETPFVSIVGSPEGGTAKPDPTLALAIAKTLGVAPGAIALMGDTRVDMETATNAGMLAVGVLWGFRPERELVATGARVLLARPADFFEKVRLGGSAV